MTAVGVGGARCGSPPPPNGNSVANECLYLATMQIKMFTIALFGEDDKLDELNRFLRGNKILGVREESVCSGGECFWTYSVRYFTDAAASKTTGSKKKDYRSELDEPTFQYFLTLKQRNHYLCGLDHFAKEELKCRAYVRYMDDFVIWHDDRNRLKFVYGQLKNYLNARLKQDFKTPIDLWPRGAFVIKS